MRNLLQVSLDGDWLSSKLQRLRLVTAANITRSNGFKFLKSTNDQEQIKKIDDKITFVNVK